jgi:hypothetical protein
MMQFSPATIQSIKSSSQRALTTGLLLVALLLQLRSSIPNQDYTTQSNW